MKYCAMCGTDMVNEAMFCPNCGTQSGHVASAQTNSGQYFKGMKATGGLKIWLWILIVGVSISMVFYLIQAYQWRWAGAPTVLLFLGIAAVLMIEIFGVVRLLNGFRQGLYIICGCMGLSIIIDTINRGVYGFVEGGIYVAIALGILWFFTKKQWEYFK